MRRALGVVTGLAAGLAAALAPISPADAENGGGGGIDVAFIGDGGVELHGTVITPPGAQGRHPAMVMLEGAGNRGRDYLRTEAEAYARRGVVTLIYDKRKTGYSLIHRDYSVLADDALAGLRLLRDRPDVDPVRLGMWALSEGAWVAPIAANRSNDVKFLITVGGVGTTPDAQTAWGYNEYLRHAGVTAAASSALRTDVLPAAIAAGLFPEHDFDATPEWRRVRQPVLAEWGELDRDSVPAQSQKIIGEALTAGGNGQYKTRIVPGLNHNLHVTAAEGFDRQPQVPDDYGSVETTWIETGQMTGSNVTPASNSSAETIVTAPWYHRPWPLVAMTVLLLAGFLVAPVRRRTSVRYTRSRSSSRAAASSLTATGRIRPVWPLRTLAVTGPVVVAGTLLYLMFLLATAGKVIGPLLLGRPLPWLALELLTVATAAAGITAAVSWWRNGRPERSRVRLGVAVAAAVLLVPWVASWGLLSP
ncbi:alpha/beta hydrolase family protein [Dactylosporangium sp. NPDC051541]|uniref:alpha/beta hydrolase family protein n=1 Tax=Dactylosporangium sp. NPDC051541 TaxID=3363977 RepID=UPI00378DF5D2